MAEEFNIVVQLQLEGPNGLDRIVGNVQQRLKNVKGQVGVDIDPRSFRTLAQMRQELDSTGRSMGGIEGSARQAGRSVSDTGRKMSQVLNAVTTSGKGVTTVFEVMGRQAGITARRIAGLVGLGATLGVLGRAASDGFRKGLEFERELIRIGQVSGDTSGKIKEIAGTVRQLASSLGVSGQELIKVATIFKQAGLSIQETKQALESVALADLAPNFDSIGETAEGLIAVRQQFKVTGDEFKKTIGSINAVAGSFAVEASDLIDVVRRTGGAFNAAGGNLNELIGVFTAVRSTTRESAQTIATGLRTIFTRLQRPEAVNFLKQFGVELRRTAEEAEALGDPSSVNQFVGAFEAIRRIGSALGQIPETDSRFAAIIEQLGGYRQVAKVVPLVREFATAQSALNTALAGGVSLEIAGEKAQRGLINRYTRLSETVRELFSDVVESDAFQEIARGLADAAEGLVTVIRTLKPLVPLLAGFSLGRIIKGSGGFATRSVQGFTQLSSRELAGNNPIGFATGGFVPGKGNADSVPAMLTPGEFVLTRDAARRFPISELEAFNRGQIGPGELRRAQRFNRGGLVQRFAEGGGVEERKVAQAGEGLADVINDVTQTIRAVRIGDLKQSEFSGLAGLAEERAKEEGRRVSDETRVIVDFGQGGVSKRAAGEDGRGAKRRVAPPTLEGFATKEQVQNLDITGQVAPEDIGIFNEFIAVEPRIRQEQEKRRREAVENFDPKRVQAGQARIDAFDAGKTHLTIETIPDLLAQGRTLDEEDFLSETEKKNKKKGDAKRDKVRDAIDKQKELLDDKIARGEIVNPGPRTFEQFKSDLLNDSETGDIQDVLNPRVAIDSETGEIAGPALKLSGKAKRSQDRYARELAKDDVEGDSVDQFQQERLSVVDQIRAKYDAERKASTQKGPRRERPVASKQTIGAFDPVAAQAEVDQIAADFQFQGISFEQAEKLIRSGEQGTDILSALDDDREFYNRVNELAKRDKELKETFDKVVADQDDKRAALEAAVAKSGEAPATSAAESGPPKVQPPPKAQAQLPAEAFATAAAGGGPPDDPDEKIRKAKESAPKDDRKVSDVEKAAAGGEGASPPPPIAPPTGGFPEDEDPKKVPKTLSNEKFRRLVLQPSQDILEGQGQAEVEKMQTAGGVPIIQSQPAPDDPRLVRPTTKPPGPQTQDGGILLPLVPRLDPVEEAVARVEANKPERDPRLVPTRDDSEEIVVTGFDEKERERARARARSIDLQRRSKNDNLNIDKPPLEPGQREYRGTRRAKEPDARPGGPGQGPSDLEILRETLRQKEAEVRDPTGQVVSKKDARTVVSPGGPVKPGTTGLELKAKLFEEIESGAAFEDEAAFQQKVQESEQVLGKAGAALVRKRFKDNRAKTPEDLREILFKKEQQDVTDSFDGVNRPAGRSEAERERSRQIAEGTYVPTLEEEEAARRAARSSARTVQGSEGPKEINTGGEDVLDQDVLFQRRLKATREGRDLLPVEADASFTETQQKRLQREREIQRGEQGADGQDLIDTRTLRQADKEIRLRGGEDALSEGTKDDIRNAAQKEQAIKTEKELIAAEAKLVRATAKAQGQRVSYAESEEIAQEKVTKALAEHERVILDANGKVKGFATSVDKARAANIDVEQTVKPTVRERIEGVGRGVAGGFRRFGAGFNRINDRLSGVSARFGGFPGVAAGIGAGFIGDKLSRSAGTAQDAIESGSETGFRVKNTLAGGLQGATAGAALGSAFGPLGSAIGGTAGALVGLASAAREADKALASAKFEKSLDKLSNTLGLASRTEGQISGTLKTSLSRDIESALKNADSKALADSRSTFGGVDPLARIKLERQNVREGLGGRVGDLSGILQRDAIRLAKEDTSLALKDDGREAKTPLEILKDVQGPRGGLNDKILDVLSKIQDVDKESILNTKEFVDQIVNAQRQVRVDAQRAESDLQVQKLDTQLGRLVTSIEIASSAMERLSESTTSLQDVFGGTVSNVSVSTGASSLSRLTTGDKGALEPLRLLARIGGSGGQQTFKTGQAVQQVGQVLPGALTAAAARGGEGQISDQIGLILTKALGADNFSDLSKELQQVVQSAADSARDVDQIREQIKNNVGGLSQELLQKIAEPIINRGQSGAQGTQNTFNSLLQGLNNQSARESQIGQSRDQLSSLQGSGLRLEARIKARRNRDSQSELDYLSLNDLQKPFVDRQQRLTGRSPGSALLTASQIGNRLDFNRTRIQTQDERVREAARTGDASFKSEAESLNNLKTESANLQQALKNLANVSERNAGIQEKLNKLNQEEQARLSIAERIATADPLEQLKINRGFGLVEQAAKQGNLNSFTTDQRKLIIETLNSVGSATLFGIQGEPTGTDFKNQLLENSVSVGLTQKQKDDREDFEDQALKNQKEGEEAQSRLIKLQEAANQDLVASFKDAYKEFFSELKNQFSETAKADRQQEAAEVGVRLGDLKKQREQRQVLAQGGINTPEQLANLVKNEESVAELTTSAQENRQLEGLLGVGRNQGRNIYSEIVGQRGRFDSTDPEQVKALQENLVRRGYGQDRAEQIIETLRDKAGSPNRRRGVLPKDPSEAFAGLLSESVNEVVGPEAEKKQARITELSEGLTQQGLPAESLTRFQLTGGNVDTLFNTAKETEKSDIPLGGLGDEIEKTRKKFEELNASAERKAAGGIAGMHPGSPRGTDTVPAWLTKGEFVVNQASAVANRGLLEKINNAKGPVYLQSGGFSSFIPNAKPNLLAQFGIGQGGPKAAFGRGDVSGLLKQYRELYEQAEERQISTNKQVGKNQTPDEIKEEILNSAFFGGELTRVRQRQGIRNFNRRSRFTNFQNEDRPGSGSQLNVFNRVIGNRDNLLEGASQDLLGRLGFFNATNNNLVSKVQQQKLRLPFDFFAEGGHVSGVPGMTGDVHPALLSGGEFVLNKNATARFGLHNLMMANRFAQGGLVGGSQYLEQGGVAGGGDVNLPEVRLSGEAMQAMSSLSDAMKNLNFEQFNTNISSLNQALMGFAQPAEGLTKAIESMPRTLQVTGSQNVTVNITGAEALNALQPEIEKLIQTKAKEMIGKVFRENMPEANVDLL